MGADEGGGKVVINIPDDPIIRCMERTGWPPWMQNGGHDDDEEWEDDDDALEAEAVCESGR